jgi:hypothetical protein
MADNGQIDNVYLNFEVEDNGAEQKITALDNALEKLENTVEKLDTSSIDKALEKISSGDKGSNAFDGISKGADKAAVSIDYLMSKQGKLDGLQNELAQAYTKLLELTQGGAGYENQDVKKLVRQIERLEKDIDKLGNDGSNAFKKIDKSTKKANNSSKNYNKGLRGLLETAKRFLIFGTFFTIQRQISQAFKDGTTNLYQYSKAIDGTFAQSMDRLSTSFLFLKNAIGAAVAPIINAVTPALESLIDTVAEFGNKLAETFAALTGATTFKKAIKSHKEYAEAVNATNNALAKFDEINNITTSKGDKNQDYGSMFETAEVKTKISSFGEAVGKGLNNIIESINNKIKSIDFRKFASTIFTEITNFIKEINWLELGDLFSTSVVGAFNFIEGVLDWLSDTSNIDTITDGLTEFVDGIDFEKIGESFSKVFKKAIIAGIKLLFKLGEVKKKITNSLQDAIYELLGGAFEGLFGDNIFSKYLKLGTKIGMIALPALMGKGFANGGYPTSGEMFIARENGIPEMVGSIGGRTAVANNDQIVEAVSVGVYNAVVDAMSRSGGNKQPTIVQINGREVFRAVQDESTAYSKRTGQPAF